MMTKIVIPEEVVAAVEKTDTERLRNEWYKTVSKAVSCKQAVVVPLEGLDEKMAKKLNTPDIKVIPVRTNSDRFTGHFAIFNGPEIDGRDDLNQITMEVPNGMKNVVLGAALWQVREWVSTSWLRRRHVSRIWVKGV